jgi:molecular chaperone GrpE
MKKHPEEEIVDFEPEEEMGGEAAAKAKLKKLRDELEAVKKERQEYLDGWQRAKADAINQKKELAVSAERSAERKIEAFAEDIFPALDSFDMAAQSEAWSQIDDGWRSGMERVQSQLLEALRGNGIERFGKVGEAYDPHLHEAAGEAEDVAGEPGSIVRILRYGYRIGERVVRPAQVIIKKHA